MGFLPVPEEPIVQEENSWMLPTAASAAGTAGLLAGRTFCAGKSSDSNSDSDSSPKELIEGTGIEIPREVSDRMVCAKKSDMMRYLCILGLCLVLSLLIHICNLCKKRKPRRAPAFRRKLVYDVENPAPSPRIQEVRLSPRARPV